MKKFSPISLAKAGLLLVLVLLWLPVFLHSATVSSASFESVREALLEVVDPDFYPAQDNQKIKRYLALDPSQYEQIEFFRTDNTLDAQELVLVRFSPQADTQELRARIAGRVDSQMDIFEGYAPEQYALVSQNLQDYQGNYALYYVGEDVSKVRSTFENALKGNG